MDIRSLLDCDLYVTDFPQGISVIWKPLTLKDHKRFQALVQRGFLTEDEAKIEAFKICVIENNSITAYRAGIVLTVGALIFLVSGFDSLENFIQQVDEAKSTYGQSAIDIVYNVILLAFPSYTYHDVDKLTKQELLKLFALADSKLRFMYGKEYNAFDFHTLLEIKPTHSGFATIDTELENLSIKQNINYMDMLERESEDLKKKRLIAKTMDAKK